MEVFIIVLALLVSLFIGGVLGFAVASLFEFDLMITRKADYDLLIADYEKKVEELQNMMNTITEESKDSEYSAYDMFPPNLDPEFGIPRSVKR